MSPLFWPNMPPIGPGYLQAFLDEIGIGAEILDINNIFYNLADESLKKQWLVSSYLPLENNILSIIKENYSKYYDSIINDLFTFDVLGFSCFKSNFKTTLKIAGFLKSKRRDIRIVLGGHEITRLFYRDGKGFYKRMRVAAGFFIVGEGERPLAKYLKAEFPAKGASCFDQLESLKGLPFPKYRDLDFSLYPKKESVSIQFSRGCVRKCDFCSEKLLHKGFM